MTDYNELKKLAEAANCPQGNMTSVNDWMVESLKAQGYFRIAASPTVVSQMLDHIAQLEANVNSLHIKLAGEALRADQGWERYEYANKSHMAALDLLSKK